MLENHFLEGLMRFGLRAPVFGLALLALPALTLSAGAVPAAGCGSPGALGVSRTVEIDTTGGPGFGFEHYKAYDFLQAKEVVLTFDDGPQKFSTELVLQALAEHCTKAIFFSIGKMALGYPEIIREVAKAGHTIGTHTWSHQSARKAKTFEEAKDEIERGASGVKRALGSGVSPFFRFPALEDTPETLKHLADRNIAVWSTDIDSFDFKPQPPEHLVKTVMAKLEKRGKGIILMHDIHKTTAKAVPLLLAELKDKGYKIVFVKAKSELQTLAEYDASIEKNAKGLPTVGAERPAASVIKTIEGTPPPEEVEAAKPAAAPAPAPKAAAAPAPAAAPTAPQPAAQAPPAPKAEAPKIETAPPASVSVTAPAAPSAAPAPVATVPAPAATASIKTAEDDPPPVYNRSGATPPVSTEVPQAKSAQSSKSISERAKEIWELWFGK
jgi:peptidoglycan-N-acetylglucosamine deacetylase